MTLCKLCECKRAELYEFCKPCHRTWRESPEFIEWNGWEKSRTGYITAFIERTHADLHKQAEWRGGYDWDQVICGVCGVPKESCVHRMYT